MKNSRRVKTRTIIWNDEHYEYHGVKNANRYLNWILITNASRIA